MKRTSEISKLNKNFCGLHHDFIMVIPAFITVSSFYNILILSSMMLRMLCAGSILGTEVYLKQLYIVFESNDFWGLLLFPFRVR